MDIKKRLGWKRGLPEKHAFQYFPKRGFLAIPPLVNLEPQCPSIYDQEVLGSCVTNAGGALAQFLMKKLGRKDFIPSRLAMYYWCRLSDRTVNHDSGTSLTTGMKVMARYGCPRESTWKYDVKKFRLAPGPNTTKEGRNHRLKPGLAVKQDLTVMKSVLAEGFPFIFGFSVYKSFSEGNWDKTTGMMPLPKSGEELYGGHAVMAVGYDDVKNAFKIRNSWGSNWGQKGHFWMPYSYITDRDYADDFWTCHDFATFQD